MERRISLNTSYASFEHKDMANKNQKTQKISNQNRNEKCELDTIIMDLRNKLAEMDNEKQELLDTISNLKENTEYLKRKISNLKDSITQQAELIQRLTLNRIFNEKSTQTRTENFNQDSCSQTECITTDVCIQTDYVNKDISVEVKLTSNDSRIQSEVLKSCASQEDLIHKNGSNGVVQIDNQFGNCDTNGSNIPVIALENSSASGTNNPKILLLSDSQGRSYSRLLKQKIESIYDVMGYVRPGAETCTVTKDIDNITKKFTKSDFVIVFVLR